MVINLPQNALNFTSSHLDLKKTFPGRNPAYRCAGGRWREGEGIKGRWGTKWDGEGWEGWERKGGGRTSGRGILLQGLKGDRHPWLLEFSIV